MAKGPSLIKRLFDRFGRPVDTAVLTEDVAGPTVSGIRSIISGHPAVGLTPTRLATLLRTAEAGHARSYFELAEEMEEKDLHYLGVLGTRKRQVAQLEVSVEAASDNADDQANADLVRDWLARDSLQDDLFDILDAVGKGVSVSQIDWDVSESQWWPQGLCWVDPRWLQFDRINGQTIRLYDGSVDGADLQPFKFVTHQVKAKSGLPVRGGLARAVAWMWMFKNYAVKDWVSFCEVYGLPLRVGKYGPGATPEDKAVLLRAVSDIGTDAAAIIPDSMMIEFVAASGSIDATLFSNAADWFDRQISKGVLGQTGTTDMQKGGGFAQSKTLDGVREDIEQADAKALAGTLNRDVVRPLVDLNRGPPAKGKYPRIAIGRAETWDAVNMMPAIEKAVSMGARIEESVILDRLGMPDAPEDPKVRLLQPPGPSGFGGGAGAPDAGGVLGGPPGSLRTGKDGRPLPPGGGAAQAASQRVLRALKAALDPEGRTAGDDIIDRFNDQHLDEWEQLVEPAAQVILDAAARCSTFDQLKAELTVIAGGLDVTDLADLLARGAFAARLAGLAGQGASGGQR